MNKSFYPRNLYKSCEKNKIKQETLKVTTKIQTIILKKN